MRIVIIGNGVAGMEAALGVAARNPEWTITIVSEESDHFFSRTALMWVVCGQMSQRDIEPLERDIYDRMGFRRVRARAIGVDVNEHMVKIAGGHDPIPYDRLLIACGSRPRPGPWPGSDLDGVGSFVTMQDLEWLETEIHGGASRGGAVTRSDAHLALSTEDSPYQPRKSLRGERGGPPKHPVVVGGGLIGIEAVEVFAAAKLHPKFLIREEWFWPMAIDGQESAWITERMRGHGVDVRLEENLESIEGEGAVASLKTDVATHDCDLLVVAIGVMPNTDWLEGSDLARDRGGLLVDAQLRARTVDGEVIEDVFAAGDCASVEWFNCAVRPEQLWYTSRDQGRVAARGLCGDTARYARGHWYNSAKLMDIEYTTAGLVNMNVEDERNWFFEETGKVRSTTRIVLTGTGDDERVVGFNLLGRRWDHEVLLSFIEQHRSLQWVLDHLAEASFDTEFVPPLRVPREARSNIGGPAPSAMREPVQPPGV